MNIFNATADFERWLAKRLPMTRRLEKISEKGRKKLNSFRHRLQSKSVCNLPGGYKL